MGHILHAKRGTPIILGRVGKLMVSVEEPMARFLRYCRFDPCTGCVLWDGGTTAGRGKSALYGAFHFEGKAWKAHRWAAKYIHKLEIGGFHVDHCCSDFRPGLPNTLCVEHLRAETNAKNVMLMHERRRYVLQGKGLFEEDELYEADPRAIPWYDPPEWYAQAKLKAISADCPF